MNVRDYWISKLPTVRKQSPSTGKLVESLLVNDSKVARETLVEMTKLNENEFSNKDEFTKDIKNDLKQTFLQASNSLSQHKSEKEVFNQIINSVKEIENKYGSKISSKIYITETTHKADADDVYRREKDLFRNTGFKKEWDKIHSNLGLLFVTNTAAFIASTALGILFGVFIYRKFKDKGHKIIGVIIGVFAGLFMTRFYRGGFELIFDTILTLINYLISLVRNLIHR